MIRSSVCCEIFADIIMEPGMPLIILGKAQVFPIKSPITCFLNINQAHYMTSLLFLYHEKSHWLINFKCYTLRPERTRLAVWFVVAHIPLRQSCLCLAQICRECPYSSMSVTPAGWQFAHSASVRAGSVRFRWPYPRQCALLCFLRLCKTRMTS